MLDFLCRYVSLSIVHSAHSTYDTAAEKCVDTFLSVVIFSEKRNEVFDNDRMHFFMLLFALVVENLFIK